MGLKSVQHVGLPRGTVDKTITLDPAPANGDLMIFVGVSAAYFGPTDNSAWTGWTAHFANSNLVNASWSGPVYSKVCDGTETQITWQNPNSAPRAASCAILILDNDVTQIIGQNASGAFGWNAVNLADVDTDTASPPAPGVGTSWTGGLMIRCNGNVFNPDYTAESMDAAGDTVEMGETWVSAIDEDSYLSTFATPMPGGTGTFDLDHTNWTTVPRYYAVNLYLETPTPTLPGSGVVLQASPESVAFTVAPGGTDSAAVTVSDANATGATVSHTDNASWLTVTPASGAEPQVFQFAVDTAGLANGDYTATVTFTADGGTPLAVPVTLSVAVPGEPVSVVVENARTEGRTPGSIAPANQNGEVGYLGFSDKFSVNAGETIGFKVDSAGVGVNGDIDIYRFGHYGGDGKRLVATVPNTATNQVGLGAIITGGNGDTTMAAWSQTASWAVPAEMASGMFVAAVKDGGGVVRSWIPFVVRNDSVDADFVVKISDSTWAAAYNYFGDQGSEFTGKNVYGDRGGANTILDRGYAMSYDRPIVTRGSVINHFDAMELPFIDWAEANGFSVKYIGSYDLDQQAVTDVLGASGMLVSLGHDEYWSQNMWDNAVAFRDAGGHLIFMSANAVFWRGRYTDNGRVFWCFKDTMAGPGPHVAGDPLDPDGWTGTFRDMRRPGGSVRESQLTGATFRMNNDPPDNALSVVAADYGDLPFWRNTSVAAGSDLVVNEIVGFEADSFEPPDSGYVLLGRSDYPITGAFADNNGENYGGSGVLRWAPVMFYATPTSGVTVGFGTCQWQWGLSDNHTRGSAVANIQMRQATLNLLYDLGATAVTVQSDLTEPTPVADLSAAAPAGYGLTHTGIDPLDAGESSILYPGSWLDWGAAATDPNPYSLITEFTVDRNGVANTVWYWKAESGDTPPATVFIVDLTNGTVLGQQSVDWGTGVGWVSGTLPSAVDLVPGISYGVGIQVPAAFNYTASKWMFSNGPISSANGVTATAGKFAGGSTIATSGYSEIDKVSYFVDLEFVPDTRVNAVLSGVGSLAAAVARSGLSQAVLAGSGVLSAVVRNVQIVIPSGTATIEPFEGAP